MRALVIAKTVSLTIILSVGSPAHAGFIGKATKYVKEKIVDPVNDHVVEPVVNEVLVPFKEQILQPSGEYFSDRFKDSGSLGSKMSTFSVPKDEKITINSSDEPYPSAIAGVVDHFGNELVHFICETDAESALKNHRLFYKPISRAQYCGLRTRHHSNRLKNGYERERLKAGCNSSYLTDNHTFFRCWDADIETPEFTAAVKQRAEALNQPKLDQLAELKKMQDGMLQGKIDDLAEKNRDLDLTIREQKRENESLQQKSDMTLRFLNQEKPKFESRLKEIYARIQNFNQKTAAFANEQVKNQQDRRQVAIYLAGAIPTLSQPDLKMDELVEIKGVYEVILNDNYYRLCESDRRNNLLNELRIMHSNTRLLLTAYVKVVEDFQSNTDLDISLFKKQLLKHAEAVDQVLEPMDQIYLDYYAAIDDHYELCVQFKGFQSLIGERESLIQHEEKIDNYKALALKIESTLEKAKDYQKYLSFMAEAEAELNHMFQLCLDDAGSNKLTEALDSCDRIIARLKSFASGVEVDMKNFPEKNVTQRLAQQIAAYEKTYNLFVKDKISIDKLRTLRGRYTNISAKIIKIKRSPKNSPAFNADKIMPLTEMVIQREIGTPWPDALPKLVGDQEILAYDAKLSTIETGIDQLLQEQQFAAREAGL